MPVDHFPGAIEGDNHVSIMEVLIVAGSGEPMIASWEASFGVSFADIRPIMSGDEGAV